MNRIFTHVLLIITLLFALQVEPASAQDSRFDFTDVTFEARVPGATLAGGHGIGWVDIDNDGDLDFYVTNTPSDIFFRNYLFINQGNGKFREEAIQRGVAGMEEGSHAVVLADLDNDGDYDLIVGNSGLASGPGQTRIYENDGNGYFTDITEKAGLLGERYRTRGIGVGDFDNDGDLDFIMSNTVADTTDTPLKPLTLARIYINKGDATFRKKVGGVTYVGFINGITVADVDGDGRLDILESYREIANRFGITHKLWNNIGNARFRDSSAAVGINFHMDPENTVCNGTSLGDLDNDGDLDMLTVASDGVRVFRNDGGVGFTEVTSLTGISSDAYSAAIGDLDHDGDQDIIIADLFATYNIWENKGNWSFEKHATSGIAPPAFNDPRAISLADYDGDGDLDVGLVHKLNRIQLFRNNLDNKKWVKVALDNPNGQAGGFGSKVWLYPAGELGNAEELLGYREIIGTSGYLSQNAPQAHFGLPGDISRVDIFVQFADGSTMTMRDVERGRLVRIGF